MKKLLLLILTLLSLNLTESGICQDLKDYNSPKKYEIGGIRVSGTKYLQEDVLIGLSGLRVGQKVQIPGDEVAVAIKKLWKQGLFADVEINAEKVVNNIIFLDIHLTERPRLSKFKFTGLRSVEEEDLRDLIELQQGRIFTENVRMVTTNSIERFFKKKGYLNAKANIAETADTTRANHLILNIMIDRGKKVKIDEIVFEGNESELPRRLKKNMSETKEKTKIIPSSPKALWAAATDNSLPFTLGNMTLQRFYNFIDERIRLRLFSSSKFDPNLYETDKDAIIAYYNTKGYRDARIVEDSVYQIDDENLHIKIKLEEGPKYYFRDIAWEGNTKYTTAELDRVLDINKGDIYDQSELDRGLYMNPLGTDVSALYMDDGYLFFRVDPEESRVENDSIDMKIKIYEGAQATVDKIIIKGNTKTNEHVIRREIRSLPGHKFRRSDIMRTQREILGLGYFDPENMGVNPIPDPQRGTVDIEYTVDEKPSDQLELSAGWGGTGIVGSLGVTLNNFSFRNAFKKDGWDPVPAGDGQRLSITARSTGRSYSNLSLAFTEPWLGGRKPTSLSIGANGTFFGRVVNQSTKWNQIENSLITVGSYISLGRRLRWPDDFFTLTNTLSYQHYIFKDYPGLFILSDGRVNNFSLENTLSRNSAGPNPLYPDGGSNISLSFTITPPYSSFNNKDYSQITNLADKYKWAEFYKFKFKSEWYTNLKNKKLILKSSVKMGLLGYYNNDIGHSPFERFELGGDGVSNFNLYGKDIISMRGYEVDEITQNLNTGGDPFFTKLSFELRYPISLAQQSTIYALTFVEGGNTWVDAKSFNPFELRRSAGVGIRFILPMFGTLGFDYGIGFDKVTETTANGKIWDYMGRHGTFNVILGVEPE